MQSKSLKPDQTLYRIAKSEYELWRPVSLQGYGRFDSSDNSFNTLYCAERPLACFLETLQTFRTALSKQKSLSLILDKPIKDITGLEAGEPLAMKEWRKNRKLLEINIDKKADFLDLAHHQTIQFLGRQKNIASLIPKGEDFDLSMVTGSNRKITQQIADIAYTEGFNGIYYISRFGRDLDCYVIFNNIELKLAKSSDIKSDHNDYQKALKIFGWERPEFGDCYNSIS